MSVILSAPSENSIVLPMSIEICRNPEGAAWQYGDAGRIVEMRFHLQDGNHGHDAMLGAVAEILREAIKQDAGGIENIAFIDMRYGGDFSRGFTLQDDDEYVGDAMHALIDRYLYKNKLYFDPAISGRNNDPEMVGYVRGAVLTPPL